MRARVSIGVLLVAVTVCLGPFATGGPALAGEPARAGPPPGTPNARPSRGIPTVGALFPPGGSVHTCTASVVDSATGDLLITAAHCISGTGDGFTFAPGYHDGIEPYGTWTVTGAYAARAWTTHQDPQQDVAFLVVAPHRVDGQPEQIEDVTGANRLGSAPDPGHEVTVPAYAVGKDDDPLTCTTGVYVERDYPAFNCNPYPGGTSGAPWLSRGRHGWTVVGVIGGLHQGGCDTWTSYSAAFGATTARTYQEADAGAGTSVLPAPGNDGCPDGL